MLWRAIAQRHHGAQAGSGCDLWTDYNNRPSFDHFGFNKSRIEVTQQNRASIGMLFDRHYAAIRFTYTALPITYAGRFSPLGPLGIGVTSGHFEYCLWRLLNADMFLKIQPKDYCSGASASSGVSQRIVRALLRLTKIGFPERDVSLTQPLSMLPPAFR